MLKAALRAQQRGFTIFPVQPGGKVPHRLAGSWGQTATNDINQIVRFWTQVDPTANVGIACLQSELLVIDLDRAKEEWKLRDTEWAYLHDGYGPYVHGEDLFDEMLFKLSDSPDYRDDLETYAVRTGSGGIHLYYHWPASWPKISQASPAKGVIDVRGNGGQWGGYVLAQGSVTEAGRYEYLHFAANENPIKLAPVWIRQLVMEKPKPPPRRFTGIRQPGAISWSGLTDSVKNAGVGNRNNALLWASRAMCTDGATEQEAKNTLGPPAEQAGLGIFEIERTIESAYRIQRQKEGTR